MQQRKGKGQLELGVQQAIFLSRPCINEKFFPSQVGK